MRLDRLADGIESCMACCMWLIMLIAGVFFWVGLGFLLWELLR